MTAPFTTPAHRNLPCADGKITFPCLEIVPCWLLLSALLSDSKLGESLWGSSECWQFPQGPWASGQDLGLTGASGVWVQNLSGFSDNPGLARCKKSQQSLGQGVMELTQLPPMGSP